MTKKQVKSVCKIYNKKLSTFKPVRKKNEVDAQHIRFMTEEIPRILDEGKIEKAMRWLGFMQGYLVSLGIYTLEEVKEHNK